MKFSSILLIWGLASHLIYFKNPCEFLFQMIIKNAITYTVSDIPCTPCLAKFRGVRSIKIWTFLCENIHTLWIRYNKCNAENHFLSMYIIKKKIPKISWKSGIIRSLHHRPGCIMHQVNFFRIYYQKHYTRTCIRIKHD